MSEKNQKTKKFSRQPRIVSHPAISILATYSRGKLESKNIDLTYTGQTEGIEYDQFTIENDFDSIIVSLFVREMCSDFFFFFLNHKLCI